MRRRTSRWMVAGAFFACLAIPSGASAATPIDVGEGANAHIVIDAAGTGHVTFARNVSGQDVTIYCQVMKGAPDCKNATVFSYPNGPEQGLDSGVWPLLPGDGRVLVLDARCCTAYAKKFVYTSTDGGVSFGNPVEVGDDNNLGANIAGSALYAPAGDLGRPEESLLTFGDLATIGLSFQATGTTGPPPSATSSNILTGNDATNGSLGLVANTLVAAWTDIDDNTVYWRRWSGSGDVNDNANWTPIVPVDSTNTSSGTRLASGPGGIHIVYNTGAIGSERIVVRPFTGDGWGAAVTLADTSSSRFDLAEDPAGALHFVWQDSETGDLRYRFTTGAGSTSFSPSQTLLPRDDNGGFTNLRLSVGTDSAWATWQDASPQHVRALAITPSTLPPPTEGSTVNAVPVKGTVLVKLPAGAAGLKRDSGYAAAAGFVPLESIGSQIPVGSTLDTTRGTVRLTSATNSAGKTQAGDFSKGQFKVLQGSKNPLTTVAMSGSGLSACSKLPRGGSRKAVAGARKRSRSLFSNVRGRFRTRGRNSTATVRGTRYLVKDTCSGTLTKVTSGKVSVRDLTLRRTRTVKAGHSYFARAPKR